MKVQALLVSRVMAQLYDKRKMQPVDSKGGAGGGLIASCRSGQSPAAVSALTRFNLMSNLKTLEAWFVTGSQHLYGDATLRQVLAHSNEVASALSRSPEVPVQIIAKPVSPLRTPLATLPGGEFVPPTVSA